MDLTVNGEDNLATGKSYQTDQVRLIGKTGTAQYISETGKYTSGTKNIRSFAGVFPKDNPEYIIYIAVKDLEGTSSAMGNVTKSIVESIAKYKNLSERETNKDENKYVTIKNYLNTSVNTTITELKNIGLNPIVIGDGDIITKQYPNKDKNIIINSKVYLKTNSDKKIMIDITNWNKTEVINLMNIMNIDYEINGNGKVVNFNIPIGNEITEKLVINMEG